MFKKLFEIIYCNNEKVYDKLFVSFFFEEPEKDEQKNIFSVLFSLMQ